MIFFKFDTEVKAETFRHNLEDKKIVAGFIKKEVIRLVFHKDIENEKLEEIVTAINYSSSPESWFHSVIDFSDKLTKTKTPPSAIEFETNIFNKISVKQSVAQKAFPKTYPI